MWVSLGGQCINPRDNKGISKHGDILANLTAAEEETERYELRTVSDALKLNQQTGMWILEEYKYFISFIHSPPWISEKAENTPIGRNLSFEAEQFAFL